MDHCGGASWSLVPYGHGELSSEHLLEMLSTHTDRHQASLSTLNVSLASASLSLPCPSNRTTSHPAYPYSLHTIDGDDTIRH